MTRLVVSTDELQQVMLAAVAQVGEDLVGVGAEAVGMDALETVLGLGFGCGAQVVKINELLVQLGAQIGATELTVGESAVSLGAYLLGTAAIEELLGFIGMPPTVMPTMPDSQVVQRSDYSLSFSAGEAVIAGISGTYSVEKLADGQYEVVLDLRGDIGAGGKLGVVDGEAGGYGEETLTWYVSGPEQASQLRSALEKIALLGSLGGGMAVLSALQLTNPYSTTVTAGAQGQVSVSDGTDGVSGSVSEGGFVTSTRSGELDVGASFSMNVDAHTGIQGLGISGDASGTVQGTVTVDPRTGDVRDFNLTGTVAVTGSADVFGHQIRTAPGKEIEVQFSADVDPSTLSPDLRSELAALASGKVGDATKIVSDLAQHGVAVTCNVYEGTGRHYDLDVGPISASAQTDNLTLVESYTVQV